MTKWISRASVMRIIDADPVYSDVINEKTYMASQISNLPTKEETSRPHGKGKDGNVKEAEAKKCPNCGSDLYEHCYMCCYEGEKVTRNEM